MTGCLDKCDPCKGWGRLKRGVESWGYLHNGLRRGSSGGNVLAAQIGQTFSSRSPMQPMAIVDLPLCIVQLPGAFFPSLPTTAGPTLIFIITQLLRQSLGRSGRGTTRFVGLLPAYNIGILWNDNRSRGQTCSLDRTKLC
ncbi:unnamed protein product [Protopolystoma xenopodis]|uniref:Uncharacterized protein n=1 Tax=Protopolystoma xenopodis TaxID=117903 RepID=A0A3S5BUH3_9PLAT|nr:unnamed protein product [Protopolystoma xenopodis]